MNIMMRFTVPGLTLAAAILVLGCDAVQLPGWTSKETGQMDKRDGMSGGFETEPNGTEYLWVIEDVYEGQNFFE